MKEHIKKEIKNIISSSYLKAPGGRTEHPKEKKIQMQ